MVAEDERYDPSLLEVDCGLSALWIYEQQRVALAGLKESPPAALVAKVGLKVAVKDLSAAEGSAAKGRPNTFELWFGTAPVPASCAG